MHPLARVCEDASEGDFCGSLARVGIFTYLCSRLLLIYSQYKYEILSIN